MDLWQAITEILTESCHRRHLSSQPAGRCVESMQPGSLGRFSCTAAIAAGRGPQGTQGFPDGGQDHSIDLSGATEPNKNIMGKELRPILAVVHRLPNSIRYIVAQFALYSCITLYNHMNHIVLQFLILDLSGGYQFDPRSPQLKLLAAPSVHQHIALRPE